MLDLAGADAECQRAEGTVRRGVRVTADHRHAGLSQAQLRTDDVHDPLLDIAERVQRNAELLAVVTQRIDLGLGDRIGDRQLDVLRRDVVVLGRQREIGTANRPVVRVPQTVEGLRAGDLVDEVEVDVEQVRLALRMPDNVIRPYLLCQRASHRTSHGLLDISLCETAISVRGQL